MRDFRRRDGRVLPIAREDEQYSTPELLGVERRIVDTAVRARDVGSGLAREAALEGAVAWKATREPTTYTAVAPRAMDRLRHHRRG
jgi:hypothetical protein